MFPAPGVPSLALEYVPPWVYRALWSKVLEIIFFSVVCYQFDTIIHLFLFAFSVIRFYYLLFSFYFWLCKLLPDSEVEITLWHTQRGLSSSVVFDVCFLKSLCSHKRQPMMSIFFFFFT